MTAYYNEIDPFAAAWLRQLIAKGLIAPGTVDERDIQDVTPDELKEFTQCHFFAGVGVWSYALRLAGWPDDKPIWTGSCPCQPFSAAGKGAGFDDERHLWPAFHWLIEQCGPVTVFGEQVASKDGLAWLDLVQDDLEGTDYTLWPVDLCAAGVGSPNIRQRLYWMAHTLGHGSQRLEIPVQRQQPIQYLLEATGSGDLGIMADTDVGSPHESVSRSNVRRPEGACEADELGNADRQRLTRRGKKAEPEARAESGVDLSGPFSLSGPVNGHWANADWLLCTDGKWRAVEPGTFPLAYGAPARVGRLRGYGNAINAEAAAAFIEIACEEIEEWLK